MARHLCEQEKANKSGWCIRTVQQHFRESLVCSLFCVPLRESRVCQCSLNRQYGFPTSKGQANMPPFAAQRDGTDDDIDSQARASFELQLLVLSQLPVSCICSPCQWSMGNTASSVEMPGSVSSLAQQADSRQTHKECQRSLTRLSRPTTHRPRVQLEAETIQENPGMTERSQWGYVSRTELPKADMAESSQLGYVSQSEVPQAAPREETSRTASASESSPARDL